MILHTDVTSGTDSGSGGQMCHTVGPSWGLNDHEGDGPSSILCRDISKVESIET